MPTAGRSPWRAPSLDTSRTRQGTPVTSGCAVIRPQTARIPRPSRLIVILALGFGSLPRMVLRLLFRCWPVGPYGWRERLASDALKVDAGFFPASATIDVVMRLFLSLVVPPTPSFCQAVPATSFDAPKLDATAVTYKGRSATRLVDRDGTGGLAVLKDAPFHNGAVEVELAGHPGTGAAESARGFVGIAFHVQNGGAKYEVVYLRPTNGRADDM